MADLSEKTRWTTTLRVAYIALITTLAGGAYAASWLYTFRDTERRYYREEQERALRSYVTREEILQILQQRDRLLVEEISERVAAKLQARNDIRGGGR